MKGPFVITGFMGCGKSEVARSLANQLNLPMVDLDQVITTEEGRSPAELISEDGEPAFRSIENRILTKVLLEESARVISLGGGAWIESSNRELIQRERRAFGLIRRSRFVGPELKLIQMFVRWEEQVNRHTNCMPSSAGLSTRSHPY